MKKLSVYPREESPNQIGRSNVDMKGLSIYMNLNECQHIKLFSADIVCVCAVLQT